MSSMPDIRLASFAAVVFLYLRVTVIVCQNAAISGCADSQLVDSSLTLKCRYIGKRNVTAIYWYNGSNSDTLALKPGSNVPRCDVHSTIDIFFDPHRINYTCNASSNVYTLTINPLQKLDNNVTWSCTFVDPAPDPVKAECIIDLSDTTCVGDCRISSSLSTVTILLIVCIILAVVAVTVVIILQTRKSKLMIRKKSRSKTYRRNRKQNAEVPAEETDHHHQQKPNLDFLMIMENPESPSLVIHHEQEPTLPRSEIKETIFFDIKPNSASTLNMEDPEPSLLGIEPTLIPLGIREDLIDRPNLNNEDPQPLVNTTLIPLGIREDLIQNRERDTGFDFFLHPVHAEETDHHREQEPTLITWG